MFHILVVEDAESLREVICSVLEREGYRVDSCETAEGAAEKARNTSYSCIVSDFKLPGKNGLELLRDVREISKSVPFLLMTAYGSINIAVEAMKLGANDFITKPFEPEQLCSVVRQLLSDRCAIEKNAGLQTRRNRHFITKDPTLDKLLHQAKKVALVDSSVLILGESGTGKELIARYIHDHSERRDKPFVAVNCAAIPPELLESEFFGHEAGSFTGATQTRIGVLEYAAEGTVFLDEVGDMPRSLQVKLLRALQEKEVKRVGGNRTIKAAPRIVAATNVDVDAAMADGKLREDFYYRLAVITFTIPPLRDRANDIEFLTDHYVKYFAERFGKLTLGIDKAAAAVLSSYSWPGNARELENVIERASILAENVIRPEHLGIENRHEEDLSLCQTLPEVSSRAAREAEVDLIVRTLKRTNGNKAKAAQILDVSYKTLLNKVKEYALEPQEAVL